MIGYILGRFAEWEHLGSKQSETGSRLIAHTPRDYPQAYLHRFFAPVPEAALRDYGVPLVGQLRDFYSACNGLSLFAGSLDLWGLRAHYVRDASASFQPFDLALHHGERAGRFNFSDGVFFGSYSEDGSAVFARASSLEICRVSSDSRQPLNRWADLPTFLDSEYDRLDKLFTRAGYLAGEEASTLP
jgi:hypothetical protein